MSNLILGKFALENLYYSTLPEGMQKKLGLLETRIQRLIDAIADGQRSPIFRNRSKTDFMGNGVWVGTTSVPDFYGGPCRVRTYGPVIKSKLLKTYDVWGCVKPS